MLKIGVTGNIGSGKTTISKVFLALGVPVYFSDEQARKFYYEDSVRQSLINRFGEGVFLDNELNRSVLASLIFNNSEHLSFINSLIHPRVANDFLNWCKTQDSPYILMESAIMFENGFNLLVDKTLCVIAPFEQRLKRAISRDGSNQDLVLQRMKNQSCQSELMVRCDYIIDNEDNMMVLSRVLELDNLFRNH